MKGVFGKRKRKVLKESQEERRKEEKRKMGEGNDR